MIIVASSTPEKRYRRLYGPSAPHSPRLSASAFRHQPTGEALRRARSALDPWRFVYVPLSRPPKETRSCWDAENAEDLRADSRGPLNHLTI